MEGRKERAGGEGEVCRGGVPLGDSIEGIVAAVSRAQRDGLRQSEANWYDRRYKRSMAERLRRLERVYERHPIYFLTACTRDRRKMLANDEGIRLSTWVKSLKNALSKALRSAGVLGPHWQKGFFDHVLRGAASYSGKWDYVRENPVRAGLVVDAGAWPFDGQINDLEYRRDLVL